MSFVKILVPVAGTARDRFALLTAFAAARPFNAHVSALFVHSDPREAVLYGELPLSPDIMRSLAETAAGLERAASQAAHGTLAALAGEAGVRLVASPQRGETVTASYAEVDGRLPQVLDRAARLCDLVVFAPIRGTGDSEIRDAFVRVLTKLACPVLLSAEIEPKSLGRKVAMGWDGTRTSARALMGALPFLKTAEKIELLSVRDTPLPERDTLDAVSYLSLHGLSCSQRTLARGRRPVAEVLLEGAAAENCDLLVTGGYGHSRLMETVFGGVTDSIVSHAKIPVFMVH